MRYIEFGEGTRPFVILPGLSVKHVTEEERSVAASYALISREYRVYLFDRRENLPQQYTLAEMGEDTATVIEKLGIRDATLFGVSQGGMIAIYIAAHYPGLVSNLILGSTALRSTPESDRIIKSWLELAKEHKSRELTDSFLENVYSEPVCRMLSEVMTGERAAYGDKDLERFAVLAASAGGLDLSPLLDRIHCRAFVLASEGDRIFGCAQAEEIARRLGCSCHIYGREYGHAVYDEAPDYLERVKKFLLSAKQTTDAE